MQIPGISSAPVFSADRSALKSRTNIDFRDYGFEVAPGTAELFDIVPTQLSDSEAFLFFFPREDIASGEWSLFNLHVFLKYQGSLAEFAHSRGESVRAVELTPATPFGIAGLGYSRTIEMADLFKGGEPVIPFIGGEPGRVVRDSHLYFNHQFRHCYTGLLHLPGRETRYDALREALFRGVRFVR
ncbi:hypothetical protein [Rhodopseudomonas sp. B29]|uniref:hypothetical protein n=1 Tax=Rhodopseudomonas sp. B29 TaxID=95607 RepID=UPI00034BAB5C|nr:hypothetical protein [Rhodopseudomonas sp. B29]